MPEGHRDCNSAFQFIDGLAPRADACERGPMDNVRTLLRSFALSLTIIAPAGVAADGPDPHMLALAEHVARFIETLDPAEIAGVFADRDVAIIENFAPYRFDGVDAVERWAAAMKAHRTGTSNLQHTFGTPQDYGVDGSSAFFSLPTTWTGSYSGGTFTETGGWAFLLTQQPEGWRVSSYGWAVTGITTP